MAVNFRPQETSRRIHSLRARAGLSLSAWARLLGMTIPQVKNYEAGRIPDPPFLVRIAQAAGVSVDWILTGREPTPGTRHLATGQAPVFSQSLSAPPESINIARYLAVPVLTENAATGPSRSFTIKDVKEWVWIPRTQLRRRELHRLVAMEVVGDSMEPVIRNGAVVAIDLDDTTLVKRGIYTVAAPGGRWTVKHVRLSGGGFGLLPANPATNESFPLVVESIDGHNPVIGRVVWNSQVLA